MSGTESFTVGFGDSNRNSSRVLNPPGGISSDIFGTNSLAHGPRRNVSHLQSSFSFGDAGLGESGGDCRTQGISQAGSDVYDVFPEKYKRSPPCPKLGGRLTRSEVLSVKGDDNQSCSKMNEEATQAMQGDEGFTEDVDDEHAQFNEAEPGIQEDIQMLHSDSHSTGNIQVPRVGSRNPITGYGIGVDDTREISSRGCDAHNDTSISGRNTGKRMYSTYNKRSQEW